MDSSLIKKWKSHETAHFAILISSNILVSRFTLREFREELLSPLMTANDIVADMSRLFDQ